MIKKIIHVLTISAFIFTTISEEALARAGGRSSFGSGRSRTSYINQGSRGGNTYQGGNSNGRSYAPIDRSNSRQQQNSANQNHQQNQAQPQAAPMQQPPRQSFFQRNPMLSTIGAVVAGTWIGNMLFGNHHVYNNAAASPDGTDPQQVANEQSNSGNSMMMNFLMMAVGAFLVYMLVKHLTRSTSENPNSFAQNSSYNSQDSSLTHLDPNSLESEKSRFAAILVEVQEAWSQRNLEQMKRLTTPEMHKYFSDAMHQNVSQDIENKVENVNVFAVEISEYWREGEIEYATAILEWSAFDYMINLNTKPGDANYIAEGDDRKSVNTAEAWTFIRYNGGGKWILSAIQQIS